jgi:DNA-binding beta-propeller fold protein YncE
VSNIMQATLVASARSKWRPMSLAKRLRGVALCGLLTACTAGSDEVRPPNDELFFPTGIVVAESQGVAFVTNANSELRYDSGAISVLSLDTVDNVIANWIGNRDIPSGCEQDPDHAETLICEEGQFINADAGVRIGNFATEIAVQDLGSNMLRLVVPTRGDPSIAWADWDGTQLSCNSNGEPNALCDDEHRLSFVQNNAALSSIPEEPFGVYADSAGEFAVVTHLTSGAVTLIDSPKSGTVQVADVRTGICAADPTNGLRGATGVVGLPRTNGGIVYVGSRTEDRIQTFTVGKPINDASPYLLPGAWFFLDSVGANTGGSNDTRGMAFSPDSSHLYLVNRRPPSVQIYDTTTGPAGYPQNRAIGATDICRQASTVAVSGTGDAERAYVTCFQDGLLYIIDPRGDVEVEDIVLVGRGPYAVAAAATRNKVFVTNFLEDTIAVLDTAPTSTRRNRVVLRIGKQRVP